MQTLQNERYSAMMSMSTVERKVSKARARTLRKRGERVYWDCELGHYVWFFKLPIGSHKRKKFTNIFDEQLPADDVSYALPA